jgi:hypothetical protein
MFGFASYGKTEFDFDIDLTQLQVGLGFRAGISDNTDFYSVSALELAITPTSLQRLLLSKQKLTHQVSSRKTTAVTGSVSAYAVTLQI